MTQVEIVIGSTSDLKIAKESKMLNVLDELGVSYTVRAISAHRYPEEIRRITLDSIMEGTKVFIAIASMAAALPGAISAWIDPLAASHFDVIVIGVALPSDGFADALDALYSMCRMPAGIPVLTAGIGKSGLYNAAIAAGQIVFMRSSNEKDHQRLRDFLLADRKKKKPQIVMRSKS